MRQGPDDSEDRVPGLDVWLARTLSELDLPSGKASDWTSFRKRDPGLADRARGFLVQNGRSLPVDIPPPDQEFVRQGNSQGSMVTILDRYIRNGLMRSSNKKDHELADEAKQKLRLLGVQITGSGARMCASPISRVMAYASAKYDALIEILTT